MKKILQKKQTGNAITKLWLLVFVLISLSLTNPANSQISVSFSETDGEEFCQGTSLAINAIPSGGSGVYIDYQWIDPDGVVINSLGASAFLDISDPGTYAVEVIVTDDEGTTGSGTFNFTVKPGPDEAVITADGPTSFCDGGSVTLSATEGVGYTYQWRNSSGNIAGATNQTYVATEGSNYRVIITSANGCTKTSDPFTVTVYPNPEPVATNSGPICEDGTVQFFASPDGFDSYQWSSPHGFTSSEQNPVLVNVPLNFAGDYQVTVTDNNNCTGSAITTLVVEPLPEAPASASVDRNDICADDTNDITLTATGGTGDRLVWYTGSCGGTQVGEGVSITIPRPAATSTFYARWETDGECASSACVSIEVRIRPLPVITFSNTHVSCFGGNDGSSTANVSDATPPFDFTWSTSPAQTTQTAINLTAGDYTVMVTDQFGCTNSEITTITEPDLLEVTIGNVSNVDCSGNSTGSAQAQPTGGTPPYTYLWSNGQTSQTATGLAAENYTVTVTDANDCQAIESIEITEPDELIVTVTDQNDPSCFGDNDGNITVEATGGTGDYSFSWDNGMNGASITGLTEGTYEVTVTDENGCTAFLIIVLDEPDPLTVTFSNIEHVECFGEETGSATANPDGGTAPYSYLWNDGQTEQTASSLGAGDYTVTITDANGCEAVNTVTINENNPIVINAIIEDANCFGSEDGNILVDVSGGTGVGTYSFLWSDGTTTQNNLNIGAGTYTLTVTDAGFCTAEETFGVNQPDSIELNENISPVTCFEGDDGSISVNVTGGTSPYSYLWSTGGTSNSITGLASGTYSLTLTDDNNCIAVADFFVPEPDEITYDVLITDVFCASESTGSIDISNIQGGTPPYSFSWSNAAVTQSISDITAGSYTLVITDSNGCTAEETFVVDEPDNPLILNFTTTDVICWGESSGTATAEVSGGTPFPGGGYEYLWSNSETTQTITDLSVGIYSVIVTDVNGCTIEGSIEITQPGSPLEAFAGSNAVICSGDNEGIHVLGGTGSTPTALGGTAPYTYQWTSVPVDSSLAGQENLENPIVSPTVQTVYTVVVTDDAGCSVQDNTTISIYPTVVADAGGDDDRNIYMCSGGSTSLGGTPLGTGNTGYYLENPDVPSTQFTYRWERISPNPDFISNDEHPLVSPIVTSTYFVRVSDKAGDNCIAYDTVTVVIIPAIVVDAIDDDSVCNGNNEGVSYTLGATISGGTEIPENYVITWTATPDDPSLAGQENLLNPLVSPVATTTYTITVTDSEGIACEDSDDVTLTVLPEIFLDPGPDQGVCFGSDVILGGSPTATGGSENFEYLWTLQSDGSFVSDLPNPTVNIDFTGSQTYILEVFDVDGGCYVYEEVTLTVIDEPVVVIVASDDDVCAGSVVTLTASGADDYLWTSDPEIDFEGNETQAQIDVVVTETTTFYVEGTNLCGSDVTEVTITVIPGPVVDLGEDQEACEGEIVLLDAGEFDDVIYLWSDGSTEQTLEVTETNTYSVTVTSLITGCSNTDEVLVTFNPLPEAFTGDDQTICYGDEVMLGNEGDTEPIPTNTYLWTSEPEDPSISDPTISNPVVSPTVTTTYTLVETYIETGCTNSNTVVVSVVGGLPNAGEDQTICDGESVVLGPDDPVDGNIYTWTSSNVDEEFDNNVPNPVVTPGITTTYTLVEEYTEYGCTNTDSVVITVNPTPFAETGPDLDICPGDTITIGTEYTEPMPLNTYVWTSEPEDPSIGDPTISNPMVSPSVTTTYTLTEVYTQTGCTNQNSVVVTVHEIPVAEVIDDTEVCESEEIQLGSETADPDLIYSWSSVPAGFASDDTNPSVVPGFYPLDENNQITFILEASNEYCNNTAMVVITVLPDPVPDITEDVTFCNPGEAQNLAIGGDAITGYTYLWESDKDESWTSTDANPVVTPEVTTVYTLFVTDTDTGCSAQEQVVVTISDLTISAVEVEVCDSDELLALGDYVTVSGGMPPYQYYWTDNDGNDISNETEPIVSAPLSISYNLNIIDQMGCPVSVSLPVNIIASPETVLHVNGQPAGSTFSVYLGQTVIFEAMPAGYDLYEFFIYDEDSPFETLEPIQSGTSNVFTATGLQNEQRVFARAYNINCMGESEWVNIIVNDLPNAFTPDGDGINEIFAEGFEVSIFNRWGQKVYEGIRGWDGTYNGRKVSPGTYYYIVNIYDENNNKTTLKGSVTVIINEN